jgi:glycosyltransferase involved in cell wall biosynthesis
MSSTSSTSAPRRTLPSITAVLPAYNEAENIKATLDRVRAFLPTVSADWELIVVNDGSKDNTEWIVKGEAKLEPRIKCYNHAMNRGYGAALQTGIFEAHKEYVFFMDSDGQFDITELHLLIEHIDHHDIVAGYRHNRQDPWNRRLNAWGWNRLVRLVLGVRIIDIDCAFKLFRRSVFDKVLIRSLGAMVNTEILAQAQRFELRLKEIPVTHFARLHGNPTGANIRVVIKAFRELMKLWWKLRAVRGCQKGILHGRPVVVQSS